MNTNQTIKDIIAGIDVLLDAGEDAKAEEALQNAIASYTAGEPDNLVGQSVLLNELGGFYRNRGIFDKGEAAYGKAKSLLEQIRGAVYQVKGPVPDSGCCTCGVPGSESCFPKDTAGKPSAIQRSYLPARA